MTLTLDVSALVRQEDAAWREKRLRAAVAMFDAGLVTQAQATQIAELSRVEFFDALGRYGVTPFQYDWEEALNDAAMLAVVPRSGSH